MFSTALGLGLAGIILFLNITDFGRHLGLIKLFFDLPAFSMVVGCSITALLTNYSFKELLKGLGSIKFAFKNSPHPPQEVIDIIVKMAVKARREGMLSLKEETTQGKYPLLDLGASLLADGTDPEDTAEVLEAASATEAAEETNGETIWRTTSIYAPMFGMGATLVGLILMLRGLSDPSTIGPAMALALVATFYGVIVAGIICLPIAGKIHTYFHKVAILRELIIVGLLSIQAGNNSQIINEKLKAHIKGIIW
ncbi:MAG: MotA/TolQ/ExbB proton channel family protein [Candidatus Omnitrophota bacterium]